LFEWQREYGALGLFEQPSAVPIRCRRRIVYSKQEGKKVDYAAFTSIVGKTVDEIVRRQSEIGIDGCPTVSGPHHHDVALSEILEPVLGANVAAYSFEGANPQHEHEWKIFEKIRLAQDKIIIPGVIDTKTNVVEHPNSLLSGLSATRVLLVASG
jgi:methionine synthase II (cobalamin-independent)